MKFQWRCEKSEKSRSNFVLFVACNEGALFLIWLLTYFVFGWDTERTLGTEFATTRCNCKLLAISGRFVARISNLAATWARQILRANGSVASTLSRDMLLLLVVVMFRGRGLGFGVHQGHQSTAFAHSVHNDEKKYRRTNLTNVVKAASRNLPINSKKRTPQKTGYQTMLTLLIPN